MNVEPGVPGDIRPDGYRRFMQERNWLVPVLVVVILILIFGIGGVIKGAIWAIIIALALIGAAVVWGYFKSNARR